MRWTRASPNWNASAACRAPRWRTDIWQNIWYEETHNSTAIEGNTLILKEVRALLEEGRAVGAKELKSTSRSGAMRMRPSGSTRRPTARTPSDRTRTWCSPSCARSIAGRGAGLERRVPGRLAARRGPRQLPSPRHPALRRRDDADALHRHPPQVTDWLQLANGDPRAGVHAMEHMARIHRTSSASTRSATGTVAPDGSSSISSWFAAATRRPSSTSATDPDTCARWTAATAASTGRSPN